MTGFGSPETLQFILKVPLNNTITFAGGLTINEEATQQLREFSFQRVLTGLMVNRSKRQSHLYEHVEFAMHCYCTSSFPGVTDRMTFSMRPLVLGTQSRDK